MRERYFTRNLPYIFGRKKRQTNTQKSNINMEKDIKRMHQNFVVAEHFESGMRLCVYGALTIYYNKTKLFLLCHILTNVQFLVLYIVSFSTVDEIYRG
jgi:hypothetical protein